MFALVFRMMKLFSFIWTSWLKYRTIFGSMDLYQLIKHTLRDWHYLDQIDTKVSCLTAAISFQLSSVMLAVHRLKIAGSTEVSWKESQLCCWWVQCPPDIGIAVCTVCAPFKNSWQSWSQLEGEVSCLAVYSWLRLPADLTFAGYTMC